MKIAAALALGVVGLNLIAFATFCMLAGLLGLPLYPWVQGWFVASFTPIIIGLVVLIVVLVYKSIKGEI